MFNCIDGEAYILVNEDTVPTNISDLNSRAGYHEVVPVELTLKPGDVNTITFGAMGSSGTYPANFMIPMSRSCYI